MADKDLPPTVRFVFSEEMTKTILETYPEVMEFLRNETGGNFWH